MHNLPPSPADGAISGCLFRLCSKAVRGLRKVLNHNMAIHYINIWTILYCFTIHLGVIPLNIWFDFSPTKDCPKAVLKQTKTKPPCTPAAAGAAVPQLVKHWDSCFVPLYQWCVSVVLCACVESELIRARGRSYPCHQACVSNRFLQNW